MDLDLTDEEELECTELADLLGMSLGQLLLNTVRTRRERIRNPVRRMTIDDETWDLIQLIKKSRPELKNDEILSQGVAYLSVALRDKRFRRPKHS